MTGKERSVVLASRHEKLFRCPICTTSMKVVELKSLVCKNNHTFDFAKQGYINLLTRSVQSQYDRELFEARKQIIVESGLYKSLHEKVAVVIHEKINASADSKIIFDAGSGEGSHLKKILDELNDENFTGIGLDISKEGVRLAASQYKDSIWMVGDLANTPLKDQSVHVILNILSPANYEEFKRLLAPNGMMIKVVPRTNYLRELRDALFSNDEKNKYKNDNIVALFKEHFHLLDHLTLQYTLELSEFELRNLVRMSPLGWNANEETIERFVNRSNLAITVNFDILIGKK